MQVLSEVLERVPLFREHLRLAELLYPREVRRGSAYCGFLLFPVDDELAADHGDVGVDFSLVLVSGALGVKGISSGVQANIVQTGKPPEKVSVTISLGIAEYSPELANHGELIALADQALYQAKQEGRNRTVTSESASQEASEKDKTD